MTWGIESNFNWPIQRCFITGEVGNLKKLFRFFFKKKDFPPGGEHRKHLGELEQQRHLHKMARADGQEFYKLKYCFSTKTNSFRYVMALKCY